MRKLFPIKMVIRSSAGFKVEGLSGSDCRVRPEGSGKGGGAVGNWRLS